MSRLGIFLVLFYISRGVFSQLFQRDEKIIFPETKMEKVTVPEERWSLQPKLKKREHLIAVPIRKKSQLRTSQGCEMICSHADKSLADEWICRWAITESRCHVLTRKIMRTARTMDPSISYLVNRTGSKTFIHVGHIDDDYGSAITQFEDGFLTDYAHLYGFSMYNDVIRKLHNGMFAGVEQMKSLEIYSCPYLSDIDQSLKNLRYLETLRLDGNAIRSIKSTTFKNLSSLKYLRE